MVLFGFRFPLISNQHWSRAKAAEGEENLEGETLRSRKVW